MAGDGRYGGGTGGAGGVTGGTLGGSAGAGGGTHESELHMIAVSILHPVAQHTPAQTSSRVHSRPPCVAHSRMASGKVTFLPAVSMSVSGAVPPCPTQIESRHEPSR